MNENTLASLIVNCSLQNVLLLDVFIENCVDEISYMRVSLELSEDCTESEIANLTGSDFSLSLSDGTTLFCGYCDQVALNKEGDYRRAEILVSSYVKQADMVTYDVTYQDTGKTLVQVANIAFQKYGAQIFSNMDCPISYIIYQQKETDWDFVRRISNQFGVSLYTNVKMGGMQLSVGACGAQYQRDSLIRLLGMSKNIDELRYMQGNVSSDASSFQFLVEKYDCAALPAIAGDKIGNYLIFKNQLINDGGILKNHVYLQMEADVKPLSSNILKKSFVSMVLGGTVKSVEGNYIKVTLDHGASGLGGGCVDVPYESAISNSFYCMPDVGDQVFLYYENDGGIVCLGSKRSNTDGDDYQKPEEKVLNNKDQMLRLADKKVVITNTRKKHDSGDDTEISIILDDEDGITITSGNNIVFETKQDGIITLATSTEESFLDDSQQSAENGKDKFKNRTEEGYAKYVADGGISEWQQALMGTFGSTWFATKASFAKLGDDLSFQEVRKFFKRREEPDNSEVVEEEPYTDGVVTIFGLNNVILNVGDSVVVIDSDIYFGTETFSWLGYTRESHEPEVEKFTSILDTVLDVVQVGLDIAGLFPGLGFIPDLVNAGISLMRGDIAGAAVSALCAIPVAGDIFQGGKLIAKGAKGVTTAARLMNNAAVIGKTVLRITRIIYNADKLVNSTFGVMNAWDDMFDGDCTLADIGNFIQQLVTVLSSTNSISGDLNHSLSQKLADHLLKNKNMPEFIQHLLTEDYYVDKVFGTGQGGSGPNNSSDGSKPAPDGLPDGPNTTPDGPGTTSDGPGNTTKPDTSAGQGGNDSPSRVNDGGPTDTTNSTTQGDPINMATGSLTVEQVDLEFEDVIGTYSLRRVYESVYNNRGGILGDKWRFEIESSVEIEGNVATIQMPDLHLEHFEKEGGVWRNQRKGDEKLVFCETENGYSLKEQNKAKIYEYDLAGNLSAIIDIHGNKTSFIYADRRLEKIELASGLWMNFVYAGNHLSKIEDSLGRSITYEYEGDYLISAKMPNGGMMHYEYTDEGYLSKMTDLNGKWVSKNYYDRKGRVIRQELAGGEEFVAFYDEKNKQNTFLTTSTGENVIYQYNNDDLITQAIYPDRTAEIKEYDSAQHLIYSRDRMGREYHMEYNAAGLRTYAKNPEGLETWSEYNEQNLPVRIKNSAGNEWVRAFDSAGNLLELKCRISEKEWEITRYTYDQRGRVLTRTDANGNTDTYKYDTLFSRPTQYIKPDGAIIDYVYNAAGKLEKEQDAYGITTYGYNAMGHITYIKDAEGNVTKYEYDKMANLTRVTLPMESEENGKEGASTQYVYDEWTNLSQKITAEFGVWMYENDYLGNVTCIKNPRETYDEKACGTRFEYDINHHRTKTIYADGSTLLEKYDIAGNLIARTLPEQAEQGKEGYHYEYDALNRLKEIRNPLGVVEKRIVYDLNGNMVKEISAKGYLTASNDEERIGTLYEYDLMGSLLKKRIPVEVTESGEVQYRLKTYEYDAAGNRTCEKNFLDYQTRNSERGRVNVIRYRYDALNRLIGVTDSTGSNVQYTYDARGRRTRERRLIADGVWQETYYEYSATNKLICTKTSADKDGSGKEFAVTRFAYDKNGNQTKILLPSGNEILKEYDVMDRLVAESHREPAGSIDNRTEYKYDLCGNLTEILSEDGYKKTYQYDLLNRRILREDSLGAVEKYAYDRNGDLTNRIPVSGLMAKESDTKGWRTSYDALGRETATYAPDGSLWHEIQYNQCGETAYEGDAIGGVRFTYDFGGRRTSVCTKEGRGQEYCYDAAGNIIGLKDGNGAATEYVTDLWGRVTQVRLADGGIEKYGYDYAGNIISAVDGLDHEVTYRYNSMNLLASRKDAAGAEEFFAYDLSGNMISHIDRENKMQKWQYNMYGAPTTHRSADGTITESYQYDKMGRLSSAISGGMRYDYRYLPGGKLQEKLASGRTLLRYTYDAEGRRIKRSDLSGKETEYKYDIVGNLSQVIEDGKVLAKYEYTGTRPSRQAFGEGRFATAYEYDRDGNLISLRSGDNAYEGQAEVVGNTRLWLDNTYQYDGNGNMTMRRSIAGQTDYAYDACGRLARVEYPHGVESFTYDLAGNRTSRTMGDISEQYRYDNCNRLTEMIQTVGEQQTVHQYDYDRQGNMTFELSKHMDIAGNLLQSDESRFDYDAFNRMVSVSRDGKEIQKNHYDAEGLRHEMEENGQLVRFLYNENREVEAEESAEGKLLRYVRGLGIICSDSEESKTYYHYVSDEHGSTTHIVDDDGNILNQYDYDAYGNLTRSEERVSNRFLYSGELFDAATGQYYLRARFYNPVIGRFTQEDTYYGEGLNLYEYCKSNPLCYVDPTGHSPEALTNPYSGNTGKPNQGQGYSPEGYVPKPGERDIMNWYYSACGIDPNTPGLEMPSRRDINRLYRNMQENNVNFWMKGSDDGLNTTIGESGAFSSDNVYSGVRQASEYLQSQGVPRQYRKQILESFDVRTINLEVAGDNTYGLRFYGGNANAEGRYLFETFTPLTNRQNLALPYEWNSMTGIQQFQVRSGTTMITGAAAPQTSFGAQYTGGATQWYINDLEDLIICH